MAKEDTAGETRLGERPASGSSGCANCGHPFALHSNGKTACRAYACTAGPDGEPCKGFVPAEDALLAS